MTENRLVIACSSEKRQDGWGERVVKENGESFEGNGNIHYHYCGDSLMDI